MRLALLSRALGVALLGLVGAFHAVGAELIAPKPLYTPPPKYQFTEETQGLTGHAVIEFTITERGEVENIEVVECTHEDFRAPTIECVATWKFTSGMVEGQPVSVRVRQRLDFSAKPAVAPLKTRSFDGFQIDVNEDWTVSVTEANESTRMPSIVRMQKGDIGLEINAAAARKVEKPEKYVRRFLEEQKEEGGTAGNLRLFSGRYHREIAGKYRQGAYFEARFADQPDNLGQVFQVYRFSAGNREFHLLLTYPMDVADIEKLNLGAILRSLTPTH